MKGLKYFIPAAILGAFLFGLWLGVPGDETSVESQSVQEHADEEVWTCPMHPQIELPQFGKCPICGMDLVLKQQDEDLGPRTLAMSEADKKLAEIATVPVERRFVTNDVRMVGKVTYDETRVKTISAWVAGRLDRLYVDYTGVPVRKGDHLVSLYSPDLLTAQEELFEAKKAVEQGAEQPSEFLRQSDLRRLESAREKLRLWGLTPEQIALIEKRGEAEDHMLINSPSAGIVIHKGKNEGDYVQTGTEIYIIADFDHLWVKLDAYESDLPWIRYGQKVTLETEAYPGELFDGWISFLDPALDERTRTVKVRVNVDNRDRRLKPGMFVRATVRSKIAQGGRVLDPRLEGKWICPMHPEVVEDGPGGCRVCGMPLVASAELNFTPVETSSTKPLVVPASAVLVTGRRGVVYVEVPDAERPTFEGREVVLGPRAGDDYIVLAGVAEGERVVVKGNFKIDSALQIHAKRSMMSMPADPGPLQRRAFDVFRAQLTPLYTIYFRAQRALAADDDAAAAVAFAELGPVLSEIALAVPAAGDEVWGDAASDLIAAERAARRASTIDERREAFRTLARGVLAVEDAFGHAGDGVHYEVYCPMAKAAWLQQTPAIRNPFYGASMLECGEVRDQLPGRGGEERAVEKPVPIEKPAPIEKPRDAREPVEQAPPAPPTGQAGVAFASALAPVYAAYFRAQGALAGDGHTEGAAALAALATAVVAVDSGPLTGDTEARWSALAEKLRSAAASGGQASDLAGARAAFRDASQALLDIEREFGHAGDGAHYEVFCPMAFKSGAAWLQRSKPVRNPYYGAAMLTCGSEVRAYAAREER